MEPCTEAPSAGNLLVLVLKEVAFDQSRNEGVRPSACCTDAISGRYGPGGKILHHGTKNTVPCGAVPDLHAIGFCGFRGHIGGHSFVDGMGPIKGGGGAWLTWTAHMVSPK